MLQSNLAEFRGWQIFTQIRQKIFKCFIIQICCLFFAASETFDVSHIFLPLTITELSTLKQVRFFWATLYIITNKTVLMEQYANDKNPRSGGLHPLKLKHFYIFWMLNESRKFACYLIFGNTKKITDICSLHDPRSFSLIFSDHPNSLTFSSFPWLVGTLSMLNLWSQAVGSNPCHITDRHNCSVGKSFMHGYLRNQAV